MMILKRKKLCFILALFLLVFDCFVLFTVGGVYEPSLMLQADITTTTQQNIQISYGLEQANTAENLVFRDFTEVQDTAITLKVPLDIQALRFDFSEIENDLISVDDVTVCVNNDCMSLSGMTSAPAIINGLSQKSSSYMITDNDPYLFYELNPQEITHFYESTFNNRMIVAGLFSLIFDLIFVVIILLALKVEDIRGLIDNRGTIWNLAKRDFKTRYAGSYLGIFWAFVQPIVTILIYWFVFEVGFKSAPTNGFPFVLWLIAGIVPWFMFSDGITAVTNCLLEYAFLVKKVVFNIRMLPFVKIISALFVHVFFVLFSIFIFTLNGYAPSLYILQIIYYLFATIMLIIGIGLITSSVIVFFRDLGQIVQIVLQVGVWLTPIMWNLSMLSPKLQAMFKFNPTYYIVEGYRDAFINHVWFWEKPFAMLYYWCIVIVILLIGKKVFNKLKIHFADVL